MHPFFIALQFLTRIPLKASAAHTPADVARSVLYYPLVGLLMGGIIFITAYLLASSWLLSAAILLTLWVLLSGGLHLDGLADSADAWAGGFGNRDKTLEIMKDPRSGPLAVVVLVLLLLIKFTAVATLLESGALLSLLLAPVLARTCIPLLFLTTPYVRRNGLGSAMADQLPRAQAKWVVVGGFAICWLFIDLSALIVVSALTLGIFYALRQLMIKRIGGSTGDTAGAMIEIIEAVVLVALALLHG